MFRFKYFDAIKGVAIDAMHSVYGGVAKALLNLWLDSVHHHQAWYCGRMSARIDAKLIAIMPPRLISKAPRSLKDSK